MAEESTRDLLARLERQEAELATLRAEVAAWRSARAARRPAWPGVLASARRRVLAAVAGALLIAALPIAALAFHNFADVPTTAFYHDAVEWLVNRGITAGCAPGLFCPEAAVTRGQTAVFLQRTGGVLSPQFVVSGAGSGFLDLDAGPVVCQTGPVTPAYPQQALALVRTSVRAANDLTFATLAVVSTDGGSSWFIVDSAGFARATVRAGEWQSASYTGTLGLARAVTYRFGVRIQREAGSGDAADYRCNLVVQVDNRNPSFSPLSEGLADPERVDGR